MVNMSFRHSDKQLARQFEGEMIKPQIKYITYENRKIRYLEINTDPTLPLVVFIHGAPGSLSDYLRYFHDENLYSKVNLISVDRPGYGNSGFGDSETSLREQCRAIQTIVQMYKNQQIVIVGHSYGGPVAVKMAMDFQGFYKGIILLAPALDPSNEKEIKLANLPAKQPIRWLTPPALRVAADEKITHIEELKLIAPDYLKIETPICHIHGDQDSLVPYENLVFSMKKIDPNYLETITLKDVDHFLPWSHYDLVVGKILDMIGSK